MQKTDRLIAQTFLISLFYNLSIVYNLRPRREGESSAIFFAIWERSRKSLEKINFFLKKLKMFDSEDCSKNYIIFLREKFNKKCKVWFFFSIVWNKSLGKLLRPTFHRVDDLQWKKTKVVHCGWTRKAMPAAVPVPRTTTTPGSGPPVSGHNSKWVPFCGRFPAVKLHCTRCSCSVQSDVTRIYTQILVPLSRMI